MLLGSRRNSLVVMLPVLLFATLLSLPSPAIAGMSTQVEPDTILVGSELDYPPYCIVTPDGQADGFSIELFKAVAEAMNIPVKFKIAAWNEIKEDLAKGRLDALPLVGRTPERESLFDFTMPYLTMNGGIVIRSDYNGIKGYADLKGKTIAVLEGDNAEEYLHRQKLDRHLVLTRSYEEALKRLSDGEFDAVVTQRLVAIELMRKLQFQNLRLVGTQLPAFEQTFCFAVKNGDLELLSKLNEGLSLVIADGTFSRLRQKWFTSASAMEFGKSRIVVGGDSHFPPYEYLDENGQPQGFNVELIQALAKEMNLLIDIRLGPWSETIEKFDQGDVDLMSGMFYSLERDSLYDFSPAHTVVGQAFIHRRDAREPQHLADLEGLRVAVESGDIMHEIVLRQGNHDSLLVFINQEEAIHSVETGVCDVAVGGRTVAAYLIEKNGWTDLVFSKQSILLSEYCFAVKNGDHALLNILNEGLSNLQASGKYREIYSKWLGVYEAPGISIKKVLIFSLYIIIPLLVIILIIIGWSSTLRKQVIKRTAELRESKSRLLQITENARQVFWLTDWVNKQLLYVSPAYEEIFGLSVESAYHDRLAWKKPIHPDDLAMVEKAFSRSRDHDEFAEAEYRIVRKDGEIRWIWDRSFPILDEMGMTYRFVSIAEDITDRKLAQIEIHEKNEELMAINEELTSVTEELQMANRQLEEALKQAEESDRLKSVFLANMSHEIRTPMNGILGFAELLEDPQLEGEEQQRYIGIIQESGERMLHLINDLIDISKIEAGQIQIHMVDVDVHRILHDLHAFFTPEAKRKGLQFEVKILEQTNPIISTDKAKLQQVLTNLIKNAIKYTPKGEISIGYDMANPFIEFYVKDSGLGIPAEFQPRVFDRFSRENYESIREFEGAGLGLAISKAYIEALGGKIWLSSEEGRGSEFRFSLLL